ncbi:AP2-like ethylene-responsive transcription factor PLT2, partial [Mucuna pruriens]
MDVVDTVRRLSFTFSKSISMYRGVTRDFCNGKWQASFGIGSDYRFLGIFDTEEEAARASDVESIRSRGHKAITNFNTKFYDVDAILRGETDDEKVICKLKGTVALEAMQPFEGLQNLIGKGTSSTMFYGPGNMNGGRFRNLHIRKHVRTGKLRGIGLTRCK